MMMTHLRIVVTEDDIRDCDRCSIKCCAIARAAQRAGFVEDKVFGRWRYNRQSVYSLPPEAVQFVEDFDGAKPVEPLEFIARWAVGEVV